VAEVVDHDVECGEEGVHIEHEESVPFPRGSGSKSTLAKGHLPLKFSPDNSHQALEALAFRLPSAADGCCSVDLLPVWRRAWSEAWGFFVPVLPYVLVGTAIGALVYGFIPTEWVASVAGEDQPLAIPMAAAFGVPIYVNAETFFPITSALLAKGMGLGAVVALVITGIGVSLPEVSMLAGFFRVRLVGVLIVSVFVVAIGSGMIFAHVGV
jgi:uncharacterized membrane protein YraQ (UPF0718 family)